MAAANAQAPAQQLIQINWIDGDGKVDSVRVWGYARTVNDPLMIGPRVDVEVLQSALFGIQPGSAINKALQKITRKRKRREEAVRKDRKRKLDDLFLRVAERAVEVAARRRELEEEARRNEEEIAGEEEENGGEDAEYTPPVDRAGGHNEEDFNFVMVPR